MKISLKNCKGWSENIEKIKIMFKIEELIMESNLKNYLKNYKSAITYSFIVGLLLGSIPFVINQRELQS